MIRNKYRIGTQLKSKNSSIVIELTSKHNGNGHWNSKRIVGSSKNHRVFEGTLDKFYEIIKE
jgi:hypothetical protein